MRFLALGLRYFSIAILAVLLVSLLLNFSIRFLVSQALPIFGILIAMNALFEGMYRFFRGLRIACEAEEAAQQSNCEAAEP